MDFHKVCREFREEVFNMKNKDFRGSLIKEAVGKSRHFKIQMRVYFNPKKGGSIEDKLINIRAINGVTVVNSDPSSDKNVYVVNVKFHPEFDSMRPSTYVRTILLPAINSDKRTPGVRVLSIVPNSLRKVEK